MTSEYHTSCKVFLSVTSFSGVGDLLSILAITVDRYLFINMPLRYPTILTNFRGLVVCASILVAMVVISVVSALLATVKIPCTSLTGYNIDLVLYCIVPIASFTLLSVVVLYGRIGVLAWQARKGVGTMQNQSGGQRKTTQIMSLVFMVSYLLSHLLRRVLGHNIFVWIGCKCCWNHCVYRHLGLAGKRQNKRALPCPPCVLLFHA